MRSLKQELDGADRRRGTVADEARKPEVSAAGAAMLRTRSGNAGLQALLGRASDASAPDVLQRTIGDGHDLTSPCFAGDPALEAAFDDKKDSIRIGDHGAKVTKLQIALTDAAIDASRLPNPLPRFGEDGIFGPETKAAVRTFQAAMELPAREQDGIVGPVTMDLLDKQFPPTAGSAQSLPTSRPADKKVVTVNFTVLFGCTKSVSNALNVANVLYEPANIEIRAGKIQHLDKARSEALIGTDLILSEHKFTTPTSDEKALFSVNQEEGVVSAYFVKDIRDEVPDVGPPHGGDLGYAISPPQENFGFIGVAIQNDANDKTFAHELGHLLRGFGHVTTDPNALMAPGGSGTQFSAEEIATMRDSAFAKSPRKPP